MPSPLAYAVAGLTIVGSTTLTLLVTIPLYGALVRFRANYTPRGIALDGEDTVRPHVGPVVPGFFQMLSRVKRIEGFAGLYKGTMPIILTSVASGISAGLWMGAQYLLGGDRKVSFPVGDHALLVAYASIAAILTLPLNVIINRAIATPYKLPTWNARASLALLLSSYEQSRPWTLYLTPGLLFAQVIHTFLKLPVLHLFRIWLIPGSFQMYELMDFTQPRPEWPEDLTPLRISAYVSIVLLLTVILCPLEVMATRLSLQRNYARSPDGKPIVLQQAVAADQTLSAGADGEVIGVHSDADPYVGLVDCAKRMVAEEDSRVLYRGWWITMLGGSSTLN